MTISTASETYIFLFWNISSFSLYTGAHIWWAAFQLACVFLFFSFFFEGFRMDISIPRRRQYIYRRHADFYQKIKVLLHISFFLLPASSSSLFCMGTSSASSTRVTSPPSFLWIWLFQFLAFFLVFWVTGRRNKTQQKKGYIQPSYAQSPQKVWSFFGSGWY